MTSILLNTFPIKKQNENKPIKNAREAMGEKDPLPLLGGV